MGNIFFIPSENKLTILSQGHVHTFCLMPISNFPNTPNIKQQSWHHMECLHSVGPEQEEKISFIFSEFL